MFKRTIELIKQAIDTVPDIRFIVWPAIAIVAASSLIASLKHGWSVAVLGSMWVVILSMIYFIFNAIRRVIDGPNGGNIVEWPAKILIWFFTVAICAFVSIVMFLFFTGNIQSLIFNATPKIDTAKVSPKLEQPKVDPVEPARLQIKAPLATNVNTELNRCLGEIPLDKTVRDVEIIARHCYIVHGNK